MGTSSAAAAAASQARWLLPSPEGAERQGERAPDDLDGFVASSCSGVICGICPGQSLSLPLSSAMTMPARVLMEYEL